MVDLLQSDNCGLFQYFQREEVDCWVPLIICREPYPAERACPQGFAQLKIRYRELFAPQVLGRLLRHFAGSSLSRERENPGGKCPYSIFSSQFSLLFEINFLLLRVTRSCRSQVEAVEVDFKFTAEVCLGSRNSTQEVLDFSQWLH